MTARFVFREPWTAVRYAHYIKEALEEKELPVPPYTLKTCADFWRHKCKRCTGITMFSTEYCWKHYGMNNIHLRAIYARWAKAVIEAGNFHLELLLDELEACPRNGYKVFTEMQYVKFTPRVIRMLENINQSLVFAKKVPSKYIGSRYGEKSLAFVEKQAQSGMYAMNWYMEQLRERNVRENRDVIMERVEELVYWACDFLEVWDGQR
jgi:hypothetical protein